MFTGFAVKLISGCFDLNSSNKSASDSLSAIYKECPAATGKPTDALITFVKDRPGHDWRYAIDASKIESELEYAPQENFESGLEKTLDWLLANEAWWRAVMDGSYRDWIDTQYKS